MQLARTILQQNTDLTFVDEIIANNSVAKKSELVALLQQGKESGFDEWLVNYMLLDHEEILNSIIVNSYHPVIIRYITNYIKTQWWNHLNIDNRIFDDEDSFYDFFASHREWSISEEEKEKIVAHAFDETSILLWSSFFYNNRDALVFSFSKIKKNPINEKGKMKVNFIEKWFANAEREWIQIVSLYIEEKLPNQNLFEILNLDPAKTL